MNKNWFTDKALSLFEVRVVPAILRALMLPCFRYSKRDDKGSQNETPYRSGQITGMSLFPAVCPRRLRLVWRTASQATVAIQSAFRWFALS